MKIKLLYHYRNISLLLVLGSLAITAAWVFTHDLRITGILLFLLTGMLFVFQLERQHYEKELIKVADYIQDLIDGEESQPLNETSDQIGSKIQYQLNRWQKKVSGYHEALLNDRNDTQKLITEIAHQLRTPLANINNYLELLKDSGINEEEYLTYIDAISISERKLSFLIQSFIKMSRFENHLIQIKKETEDLRETVMGSAFQLYKEAAKKNINIILKPSADIKIWHDQNWLGEAVYNILDNSVKYSPADSKIEIELKQNEMFSQIYIRDYGIGIQKGEENQVFQRFYRGKSVTTEEGFGIGLYLSREIVTRHNGFLKVKREDPGLSMSIYLPQ